MGFKWWPGQAEPTPKMTVEPDIGSVIVIEPQMRPAPSEMPRDLNLYFGALQEQAIEEKKTAPQIAYSPPAHTRTLVVDGVMFRLGDVVTCSLHTEIDSWVSEIIFEPWDELFDSRLEAEKAAKDVTAIASIRFSLCNGVELYLKVPWEQRDAALTYWRKKVFGEDAPT